MRIFYSVSDMTFKKLPTGAFIVFEGGEGAGKSTQIELAEEYLKGKNFLVHRTHEPFDKDIRAKVLGFSQESGRDITAEEELDFFCEDRANHVAKVIKPKLDEGYIVLCDRFEDSTVAYQGYGRKDGDPDFIRSIREKSARARKGIEPDLVILFDIDPETGIARKLKGKNILTKFDKEDIAFHRKVHYGFLKEAEKSLIRKKKTWRWCVIDARFETGAIGDDPEKKSVWRQVKACIDALFLREFDIDLSKSY